MDINIVIVNYKMREDIEKCLNSLFQDIQNSNFKIIVHIVDNSNNSDGIKEMLAQKYPQTQYINSGGNIGFGAAQNLGFKKSLARFYLPLNPDIEFLPEQKTLEKLITFMDKNPHAGIIGPKLLNLDGSIQESCCRFPRLWDQFFRRLKFKGVFFKKRVANYLMQDFDHEKNIPVDWLMGSFMLVRNEVVEKIGFFDERFFMYFEDCDWCRRVWKANWQVVYVAEIIARHAHRRESAQGENIWKILNNPLSRIHLQSWWKYFWKWKFSDYSVLFKRYFD